MSKSIYKLLKLSDTAVDHFRLFVRIEPFPIRVDCRNLLPLALKVSKEVFLFDDARSSNNSLVFREGTSDSSSSDTPKSEVDSVTLRLHSSPDLFAIPRIRGKF